MLRNMGVATDIGELQSICSFDRIQNLRFERVVFKTTFSIEARRSFASLAIQK